MAFFWAEPIAKSVLAEFIWFLVKQRIIWKSRERILNSPKADYDFRFSKNILNNGRVEDRRINLNLWGSKVGGLTVTWTIAEGASREARHAVLFQSLPQLVKMDVFAQVVLVKAKAVSCRILILCSERNRWSVHVVLHVGAARVWLPAFSWQSEVLGLVKLALLTFRPLCRVMNRVL